MNLESINITFEDMLKRNKSTWYGLKMPKEEDFK